MDFVSLPLRGIRSCDIVCILLGFAFSLLVVRHYATYDGLIPYVGSDFTSYHFTYTRWWLNTVCWFWLYLLPITLLKQYYIKKHSQKLFPIIVPSIQELHKAIHFIFWKIYSFSYSYSSVQDNAQKASRNPYRKCITLSALAHRFGSSGWINY